LQLFCFVVLRIPLQPSSTPPFDDEELTDEDLRAVNEGAQ
jgi:hypothetical protein